MPTPKKKAAKKGAKKSAAGKTPAKDITTIKKSAKANSTGKKAAVAKPSGNKKATNTIGVSRSIRSLDTTSAGMDLNIIFKLGLGEITATHFREGNKIDRKKITQSGQVHFDNVQVNDVISINGACSGSCTLITNRQTDPPSDSSQPRAYTAGSIFDNLLVEQ
ncbi:MAG: hypothetical protein IT249_17755 [Chitinophagaceae bacterium]|nr:hypothetical protein [Chitinophagaceae bacterium]